MFGIGFTELIVIFVLLLLLVGPEKLPELAKTIGKTVGEFKKSTDEIKKSVIPDAKDDPVWNHEKDEGSDLYRKNDSPDSPDMPDIEDKS